MYTPLLQIMKEQDLKFLICFSYIFLSTFVTAPQILAIFDLDCEVVPIVILIDRLI